MFFHLLPARAVLTDNNPEIINFYRVVRDRLEALIQDLGRHRNQKEYYYQVRALDPKQLDPVQRASRFLYLNRTAYNGLWRVNRKGQYNVPFGRYKNPRILDAENLTLVSQALKRAEIMEGDFSLVREYAIPGAFIYLDPPYQPLSDTAKFTSYTADAFTQADQERLAELFRELDGRKCLLMLSNSDTPLVRKLYSGYHLQLVRARRAINCRADRRGPISEVVIRNYS